METSTNSAEVAPANIEPLTTPATKPARLIINPRAGHGRGRRYARRIRRYLENSGLRFSASFSRNGGDVEQQTRLACASGCRHIVVVGGDGTIHEAVNGILASGCDPALGIIPLGTGNDFAKALGISLRWRLACDRIVDSIRGGHQRRIDAGRCNDYFFANGIGIGLDARVTVASQRWKWLPGSLSYVVGLLQVLISGIPASAATVRYDGNTVEGRFSMAVACNGQWVGGVFHIAPRSRNDDGKFQLVLAQALNRRQVLRLAPKVIRGTHEGIPEARFIDFRQLEIELETGFPVQADGEVRELAARHLRIELLPGALSILG
ncbi:MAG: diacylglycerol kinase family protein [Gammaproteobacteria bacterium]